MSLVVIVNGTGCYYILLDVTGTILTQGEYSVGVLVLDAEAHKHISLAPGCDHELQAHLQHGSCRPGKTSVSWGMPGNTNVYARKHLGSSGLYDGQKHSPWIS